MKNGNQNTPSSGRGAVNTLREEFEALMPKVPFDYLYEFTSPFGGVERRNSPNQRNGRGPNRSVPVYTADQVREAMKAVAERAEKKAFINALDKAYDAMFDLKGDKVTRFDAQTAIRKLKDSAAIRTQAGGDHG